MPIHRPLVLFVLLVLHTAARAEKIQGTIISKSGESMSVTMKIPASSSGSEPAFERMQGGVKCTDSQGNKIELNPRDFAEYTFNWHGKVMRMISCDNSLPGTSWMSSRYIFLKLDMDGPMQMFRYYRRVSTGGNPQMGLAGANYTLMDFVLQRKGELPLMADKGSFKYQMKNYFKDCPELVEKIERDEFAYGQFSGLVSFYNSKCAPKVTPAVNEE